MICSGKFIGFNALRKVFRLFWNPCLTTLKNSFSSQSRKSTLFLIKRITLESTFGGGLNTPGLTVNKYSMSKNACKKTDFKKWTEYCVLGFIDLTIWSKFENIKITDNIMGQSLFPDEYNVDLAEKIRKTIRPLSQKLLSYPVINTLQN